MFPPSDLHEHLVVGTFAPVYERERAFFLALRDGLTADTDLRDTVLAALTDLNERYSTTIWENRYIVGGVTEQVVGAAGRALGLRVANAGKQNQGYDLLVDAEAGLSVKAHYAPGLGRVNLINTRGEAATRAWEKATIFVIRHVGIGYADPVLLPDATLRSRDAIQLPLKTVIDFWRRDREWLIEVDVPGKGNAVTSRVASDAVAVDLFGSHPRLMQYFQPEI